MFDKKKTLVLAVHEKYGDTKYLNFELYDYSIEKIIEFVELIETLEGMEG